MSKARNKRTTKRGFAKTIFKLWNRNFLINYGIPTSLDKRQHIKLEMDLRDPIPEMLQLSRLKNLFRSKRKFLCQPMIRWLTKNSGKTSYNNSNQ
jgi:hypothetical protein